MIIDGIKIECEGFNFDNPPPAHDELKNYVAYCKTHVDEPLKSINVIACPDGKVDLKYVAAGEKFERIRRITG